MFCFKKSSMYLYKCVCFFFVTDQEKKDEEMENKENKRKGDDTTTTTEKWGSGRKRRIAAESEIKTPSKSTQDKTINSKKNNISIENMSNKDDVPSTSKMSRNEKKLDLFSTQKEKVINDDTDIEDDEDDDADTQRKEKLLAGMNNYSAEILDSVVSAVDDYEREFAGFSGFDPSLYIPVPYLFIPTPMDKYNSYRELTEKMGYEYNSNNGFLRNCGIMTVMCREKPLFRFWDHGVCIYLPSVNNPVEKTWKFLLKLSMCKKHEFQCIPGIDNDCVIERKCVPSTNCSYMIAGIFRSRSVTSAAKNFQTYQIELDNSRRIETGTVNISDLLTIKGSGTHVYLLNKCDHKNCRAGASSVPFPEMKQVYHSCSEIGKRGDLKAEYNGRRCFGYGKGIEGSYHDNTNTVFLATWRMIDLYIDNYNY